MSLSFSSMPLPSGGTYPLPTRKILKVFELTAALRAEIENAFGDVWVEGEVANLKIPQSGHCYFTLKDNSAQIRAILFRSYGRLVRFIPREGEFVLIRGHLTVYEARGEYQIVVDYIEPKGIGALMAAFEALKERLRIEGLFDVTHKKPIPTFPKTIALITSPTGAVVHDFLRVIRERGFPVHVLICPVLVQGESAAGEIARAIEEINRSFSPVTGHSPIDLLVIARGGGSLEDLWAFNEEIVARAIFQSKIPVITAIGHETDTTIADFVADLRAPTPSVAAEIIAREGVKQIERFYLVKEALITTMHEKIEQHWRALQIGLRLLTAPSAALFHFRNLFNQYLLRHRAGICRQLGAHRSRQALLQQRLDSKKPVERVFRLRQKWESLYERLRRIGEELIADRRGVVTIALGQLHILSPLNILERGYSITQKIPSRQIVRDASEIVEEERVQIRLHRGALLCQVKEKTT